MRNPTLVQNKMTAARSHKLGNLGELWAEEALTDNGFTSVENLNNKHRNHGYADIYAERAGERYVVSVKTRNKLKASGILNKDYNLSSSGNHYALAEVAENTKQAKAAWIAISVEETTFNAYFGLLTDLNGKNTIPMTEEAVSSYQCLARDKPHDLDYTQIKNVYDDVVPMTPELELDTFAVGYPIVTAWIKSGGWVEIGTDHNVRSFIRALDEGGMVWEGAPQYPTMASAFKALDAGIALFVEAQNIKL